MLARQVALGHTLELVDESVVELAFVVPWASGDFLGGHKFIQHVPMRVSAQMKSGVAVMLKVAVMATQ